MIIHIQSSSSSSPLEFYPSDSLYFILPLFQSLLAPSPDSFESPVMLYPDLSIHSSSSSSSFSSSFSSSSSKSGLFRSWLQSMRSFRWFVILDFPGISLPSLHCSVQQIHFQAGLAIDTIAGPSLSDSVELSATLSLFDSSTVFPFISCASDALLLHHAPMRHVPRAHAMHSIALSRRNPALLRALALFLAATDITSLHHESAASAFRLGIQAIAASSLRTAAIPIEFHPRPIAPNRNSTFGIVFR